MGVLHDMLGMMLKDRKEGKITADELEFGLTNLNKNFPEMNLTIENE